MTTFAHGFLIQTETSQNQQCSYFLTLYAYLPSDQVPTFASAASHQHTAATRLPSLSLASCCIGDQALVDVWLSTMNWGLFSHFVYLGQLLQLSRLQLTKIWTLVHIATNTKPGRLVSWRLIGISIVIVQKQCKNC